MSVNVVFERIMQSIHEEIQSIDMDGCDISMPEALKMVEFIKIRLLELRAVFLEQENVEIQDEIKFFKEMKP
jgi:hypothetical protein